MWRLSRRHTQTSTPPPRPPPTCASVRAFQSSPRTCAVLSLSVVLSALGEPYDIPGALRLWPAATVQYALRRATQDMFLEVK